MTTLFHEHLQNICMFKLHFALNIQITEITDTH